MNIYLLRHGETNFNKDKKVQGRIDIELNETGIKQANDAYERIKSFDIKKIYSSPLKRASLTATIISEKFEINNIKIDDNLIERDFGKLEGAPVEEYFKYENIELLEGYEKDVDVFIRIENFLNNEIKNSNDDVLIVSHASFMKTVIKYLFPNYDHNYLLPNLGMIHLTYDGEYKIVSIDKRN